MSVKILGGVLKNTSLAVSKTGRTRPTAIMLKRKFFDAYQNWEDWRFFDFCAGTGSMGLEAWSRLAQSVVLVESDRQVIKSLKQTLHLLEEKYSLELKDRMIELWEMPVELALTKHFFKSYETLSAEQQKTTLVFFDPPYGDIKLYDFFLNSFFLSNNFEKFRGTLCIESDTKKGVDLDFWEKSPIPFKKVYRSSDHYLIVFEF